jgi:hypothetical protein
LLEFIESENGVVVRPDVEVGLVGQRRAHVRIVSQGAARLAAARKIGGRST